MLTGIDPDTCAVSWDWKDQPDWNEINGVIDNFRDRGICPRFYEPETGGDQYAVVISTPDLTPTQVQAVYDSVYET